MFNFFKKKTKMQKLEDKYNRLTEEAYNLSKYNRAKSDAKTAEASIVLSEIEKLENKK
jgi:hypothetical protein